MSVVFSAVDCAEVHGSMKEDFSEDGMTASVVLRCTFANRQLLADDLLSNRMAWPHCSFDEPPRALTAAIVPEPGTYTETDQGCVYSHALVTVGYDIAEEDLIAESLEPTVEFRTLDYKRFRWDSGSGKPLLEGEAPGYQLHGLNIVRTNYKVEEVPASALTLPGSVNHLEYESDLLGLTFDAETLLFHPPTLSRTVTTAGVKAWDVGTKYTWKPEGWNKYWRPYSELYERIYLAGGAAYNSYPLKDFSDFLY